MVSQCILADISAKGRPGGFAPDPAERLQPQPRSTPIMLIKEYRIPMPMSVEEYRIAQLYMIQVCSWFHLALKQ
ncbi:Membrane-associated phosphatidylinositol transfer protein 2 [Anabarilius grahami]|uniref:Membrane-associated phosphatidylinositol transfer protein 2 n=1 Tax=Anabarilius grahami TaxID=495550 RepID=A0A3N0Z6R9_ANAGA|nr:Membrane-associated phosphatidylinositol transfer protein 2 [Anabarilius grahami]